MKKEYYSPEVDIVLFNTPNSVYTVDLSKPTGGLEDGDNEF